MAESTQHKLGRVRPPRVQITYDVETGGALEKKELPLVVGIMADLAGNPVIPPPKMRERRFVEIDRDNFDEILGSITPRLTIQVDNTLANDGSKLNIEMNFKNFEDFSPVSIIQQVAPLRRLYEARLRLRDLLTKLDGNDDLDKLLQEIAKNPEELKHLKAPSSEQAPAAEQKEAVPEPA